MKTNILKYFHICFSIPLRETLGTGIFFWQIFQFFKEHFRATASEKHWEALKQEGMDNKKALEISIFIASISSKVLKFFFSKDYIIQN